MEHTCNAYTHAYAENSRSAYARLGESVEIVEYFLSPECKANVNAVDDAGTNAGAVRRSVCECVSVYVPSGRAAAAQISATPAR
jgi:hypothetical protein